MSLQTFFFSEKEVFLPGSITVAECNLNFKMTSNSLNYCIYTQKGSSTIEILLSLSAKIPTVYHQKYNRPKNSRMTNLLLQGVLDVHHEDVEYQGHRQVKVHMKTETRNVLNDPPDPCFPLYVEAKTTVPSLTAPRLQALVASDQYQALGQEPDIGLPGPQTRLSHGIDMCVCVCPSVCLSPSPIIQIYT